MPAAKLPAAFRYGVLLSAGLLLLLPYLALTWYAQPYWDDFDYAVMLARLGSHAAVSRYLYLHHSGRYFSFLLARLNPLAHHWPGGLRVLLAGVLLATGAAQAAALRYLSRQHLSWLGAAAWSVVLLLVQLWVLPSPYSAFYWFSSAMVYQVPITLCLVWPVAVLQSLRAPSRWQRLGWYVLAAAAVLAAAGTNELALVLLGWCLGWLSYAAARRADGPALRRWLGLVLLVAGASGAILTAPGNLERLHAASLRPVLPLWQVPRQVLSLTLHFLAAPRQLLALLGMPLLLAPLAYRYRHLRPAGLHLSRWAALGFMSGVLGGQLLFLGLIGWGYPAARTLNFIWASCLFSWLLVLWALAPAQGPRPTWLAGPKRCYLLLGCLALAILGPEQAAWREWLLNASCWQHQLLTRDEAILRARHAGVRRVAAPPIRGVQPQYILIIGELLSPIASASYNQDAAHWYGLDSLRLSEPGLPPADVHRY